MVRVRSSDKSRLSLDDLFEHWREVDQYGVHWGGLEIAIRFLNEIVLLDELESAV